MSTAYDSIMCDKNVLNDIDNYVNVFESVMFYQIPVSKSKSSLMS